MKQHGVIIYHQRSAWKQYAEVGQNLINILVLTSCTTDQKDKGCYRPEKVLLFRITRLQALGIKLVFVFDGPERPELKRNKKSSPVPWKEIILWKRILDRLQVPYHHAPGEAEAECVRLQTLGIVDAVWSEDSDCFMFGCRLLICTHEELNSRKPEEPKTASTTHIRIYRPEKCGLDQDGFALFALLCGGDYDTVGLRGCGTKLAQEAVMHGLDKKLCVEDYHQPRFRAQLITFLRENGTNLVPDKDFPSDSVRKAYLHPKVSSDQHLRELVPGLMNPLSCQDLVETFLLPYFNFWAVEYKTHIVPILLLNRLAQSSPEQEAHLINLFDLKLMKQTKKTATAKISFLPAELCHMNKIPTKPIKNPTKDNERAELETLRCVLEQFLPSLFCADQQITRGAKRMFNVDEQLSYPESPPNSAKRGLKRKSAVAAGSALPEPLMKNYSPLRSLDAPNSLTAGARSISRSTGFRIPVTQEFGFSIGYDDAGSNDELLTADSSEEDDLKRAIALSLLDQEPRSARRLTATNASSSRDDTRTNVTGFDGIAGISRRQMEQERLARLNQKGDVAGPPFRTPLAPASSNTDAMATKTVPKTMNRDVIDLTEIDD